MALPPTRRKPGWSLTNQLRRIWNNWGASSDWLDIIESLLRIILYEDCYASQQLVEEESTILLDWAVLEGIWKALSSPPYWRYQLIKIFFLFWTRTPRTHRRSARSSGGPRAQSGGQPKKAPISSWDFVWNCHSPLSVHSIIHSDLQLKCFKRFKRRRVQVMSAANHISCLTRW